MAQPWADRFYHSKAWLRCREAVVKDRLGVCEVCGQVGSEVHHVVELTEDNVRDPAIALGADNLQLLCHACHDATKWGHGVAVRGDLRFDALGNAVRADGGHSPLHPL